MKYILISTICLSILYLFYRLLFKKDTNFKQLRIYLLFSIFVSLLMPFHNFSINLNFEKTEIIQNHGVSNNDFDEVNQDSNSGLIVTEMKKDFHNYFDWKLFLLATYWIITISFLIRILVQIVVLFYRFLISDKIKESGYILVYNSTYKNTFSFFNLIFINKDLESNENFEKIISHEKVHTKQYHSIDILLMEVLTAFMWFNPVVWFMKQSMQLVHEYLADEGVLNEGADRLSYQELLINQIAEEKLVHITSSFNQSLIKKRLLMMNKEKITKRIKLKVLIVIPIAAFLFLGIACVNAQDTQKEKIVTAVAPTKMNVLYVGIENPVSIAVSGYEASDIEVLVTNGDIKGNNGDYTIIPRAPGNMIVSVKAKGEVVQEVRFRVKTLPQPMAYVNRQKGGEISKEDLLNQDELRVIMENFDFDITFEVLGFSVSTTDGEGYTIDATSSSANISKNQKDLIRSVKPHSKIIFDDISIKGPDGTIKKISPMVFTIIE